MLRLMGLVLLCILSHGVQAQQLPQLSTHPDFYSYYNPGAIESIYLLKRSEEVHYVNVFYKDQWLGSQIDGAPSSGGVEGTYSIDSKWNVGLGFLSDEAGAIGTWQTYGRGSRRLIQKENDFDLSLGLGFLLGGTSIDLDKIEESDRSDPLLDRGIDKSPFLRASVGLFARKNVGQGLDFFGGLSVLQFRGFGIDKTLSSAHHFYGKFGFILKTLVEAESGNQQYLEGSYDYNYQPAAPNNWEATVRYYFLFAENNTRMSIGAGFNNRKVIYLKSLFPVLSTRFGIGLNYGLFTFSNSPITALSGETALEVRLVYAWLK